MRVAWFLFAGLGLVWMSCGDSSSSDLFTPTGGSQAATGSGGSAGTSSSTTGEAGSDSSGPGGSSVGTGGTGAGGSGTGGQRAGSGGAGTSGASGAGMTGGAGSAGSGGRGGTGGAGGRGGSSGSAGSGAGNGGAGSGSGGSMPDGGGGSGTAGSAGGSPDAGPLHPIHCGNTTCAAPGQFCCIGNNIQNARCVATGGQCPDTSDRVSCDDRTDCPDVGDVCCAEDGPNGATASCMLAVDCNSQFRGQELCDPQHAMPCISALDMCRVDNQGIINGYAYCH